jgi:hypothetical protein
MHTFTPAAWLAFSVTLVAIGVVLAVHTVIGNRRARAADEVYADDHLRAIRITADDQGYLHAWNMATPAGVRPVGATLPHRLTVAAFEARTEELVIDPTLSAAEVAEIVEHVEPGTGSVASVVAATEDTKLRGPAALIRLAVAEEEAYAEAEEREWAALFAGFDRAVAERMLIMNELTAKDWGWVFYQHDAEGMHCPHCQKAVDQVSGEFRAMVARAEGTHTGEIDRRELAALLAAA